MIDLDAMGERYQYLIDHLRPYQRVLRSFLEDSRLLSQEVARLRSAVSQAQDQFSFYEREHLKKGTPEGEQKANTNADFAKLMEEALK